jgi:hypothetical protein
MPPNTVIVPATENNTSAQPAASTPINTNTNQPGKHIYIYIICVHVLVSLVFVKGILVIVYLH